MVNNPQALKASYEKSFQTLKNNPQGLRHITLMMFFRLISSLIVVY